MTLVTPDIENILKISLIVDSIFENLGSKEFLSLYFVSQSIRDGVIDYLKCIKTLQYTRYSHEFNSNTFAKVRKETKYHIKLLISIVCCFRYLITVKI